MPKVEVKVAFNTITPLWTGDAWQENEKIRPSSLIGSLRFWFEVICYFSGVCNENDFNKELGRFEKEVDKKKLQEFIKKNGNDIKDIINHLYEKQKIPLPSIIFGTTNWKSLIEIEMIKIIEEFHNYEFPIGEISFTELKHNNKIPKWYFKKGFYGKFQVIFKVEEKILDPVFYTLLNFMDKYGFWGGKWNIGYGRLEIEEVGIDNKKVNNWEKEDFEFSKLIPVENKNFKDFIENVSNFNNLINKNSNDPKIKILQNCITTDKNEEKDAEKESDNSEYYVLIQELLKRKMQERANLQDKELRHKIFGKTGNPMVMPYVPQGSKVLPLIKKGKDNGNIEGCFWSIVDLLNLENP